ncbi:MAG TPA: hydroxysteroid dehydrogenase-like protein 2, partial [Syntrophales bacterium]|nr:hydroxysteroid dehydrogenase-like protein 2 [Syntrophales bacterium]
FVAPIVLYLASEECKETGRIYNAGMGYYNRAAVVTGPGTVVGDGVTPPTVEDIEAAWGEISRLEDAKEYYQLMDLVTDLLSSFQPREEGKEGEKKEALTVEKVFANMGAAFRSEKAAGVDVVFQFAITGEGGGDWTVTVKDGRCSIDRGRHEKPTTTVTMAASDFLEMMGGRMSAMQAYTAGKIKIGGDLLKSQLIEKLFKFQGA